MSTGPSRMSGLGVVAAVDVLLVFEAVEIGGCRAPAVVGVFVIVPDEHERVALVRGAQRRVGLDGAVKVAVVRHRLRGRVRRVGGAERDGAGRVGELDVASAGLRHEARIARRLVDVVAEEDHEVEIGVELDEAPPRVVVAPDEILARGYGELHRGIVGRCRSGPRSARLRAEFLAVSLVDESVIVGRFGGKPRDLDLDGAVVRARGGQVGLGDEHLRELGVRRDLERENEIGVRFCVVECACPEDDARGFRIARGERLRKKALPVFDRGDGRHGFCVARARLEDGSDDDDGLKQIAACDVHGCDGAA